jgi:hypothetical protein
MILLTDDVNQMIQNLNLTEPLKEPTEEVLLKMNKLINSQDYTYEIDDMLSLYFFDEETLQKLMNKEWYVISIANDQRISLEFIKTNFEKLHHQLGGYWCFEPELASDLVKLDVRTEIDYLDKEGIHTGLLGNVNISHEDKIKIIEIFEQYSELL